MFRRFKLYFDRARFVLLNMQRLTYRVDDVLVRLDKIDKKMNDASWRELDVALNQEIKLMRQKIETANRMNQETQQILELVHKAAALVLKQETRASNNPSRPRKSKAPSRRPR